MASRGAAPVVHRVPPAARWLGWLALAVLGSVAVGFVVGLSRPRSRALLTGGPS